MLQVKRRMVLKPPSFGKMISIPELGVDFYKAIGEATEEGLVAAGQSSVTKFHIMCLSLSTSFH
jgi:hypothetical protein